MGAPTERAQTLKCRNASSINMHFHVSVCVHTSHISLTNMKDGKRHGGKVKKETSERKL